MTVLSILCTRAALVIARVQHNCYINYVQIICAAFIHFCKVRFG